MFILSYILITQTYTNQFEILVPELSNFQAQRKNKNDLEYISNHGFSSQVVTQNGNNLWFSRTQMESPSEVAIFLRISWIVLMPFDAGCENCHMPLELPWTFYTSMGFENVHILIFLTAEFLTPLPIATNVLLVLFPNYLSPSFVYVRLSFENRFCFNPRTEWWND